MDAPVPAREAREAQKTLLESLTALGSAAFDPNTPDRHTAQQQLSDLLQRTPTVSLLPALNVLIQPGRVPDVVRVEFVSQLALLPLRSDGVRATLEFVFSVHPSNANSNASAPQKQGAQITLEALKMATRLLASPPVRANSVDWFRGIAPQLLALLDGHDGLELAKVAAYVIGFGILGRKSFGAPGMPGWANFAEPMLQCIDPTTSQTTSPKPGQGTTDRGSDSVIDLRRNATAVLVSEDTLAEGLRRLQTLVISHPNPGLTRRLLSPVILPLWALSSWSSASKKCEEDYCLPARNLLKVYLKISTAPDKAMPIVRDLLFEGSRDAGRQPQWQYQATDANENSICIVSAPSTPPSAAEVLQTRWNEIGPKSDALVELLSSIATDDEDISSVFLDLFSRWLSSKKPRRQPAKDFILVKEEDDNDDKLHGGSDSNPLVDVLEGSMLQKMMEKFPEKLAGRPNDILELVSGLLNQVDEASLAEDETVPLLMSLLNLVVTAPGFRKAKADATVVQSIEVSLGKISRVSGTEDINETAQTAKNLLLFLKYRDEIEDPKGENRAGATSTISQQQIEERKTYSLAISYITQADSPPPVRSEGLNLLQGLILSNSSILDVPALLVMMSSMLDENEDYVNLRVIKIFTVLADKHPKSTTKELLDHYVDANEMKGVETRLRFGEALLQVVQRLGATFSGDTAKEVGQALLEIAGRRGFRPKTKAKQEREQRMRDLKAKRKAPGGDEIAEDDEDIDIDDALLSDEERSRNEILGRIVDGWGSKRGSEDVRIRASALSIFAFSLDVNIAGLGATLASGAVDLSLHVLTMEPELEKAILRRAAIVLILSFVRALHDAREAGRRLGFGLVQQSQDDMLRILQYVADTDEDGLVKQHAIDVIESLENWKLTSLLAPASEGSDTLSGVSSVGGLAGLAGLSIDPTNIGTSTSSTSALPSRQPQPPRPRIEEIE
ncbi:hypothetical protein HMPREF1624_06786 [Sporothrix schenckii ATCC 58251]|uniref:RNA polymerase II assembly factor Rtp1 C-terminal domain-containing protein n=1 Tax=Sporothrix schenckii (strain ATCC 58251 / de Perez 2211183) TaxID=1391915 RepID=U7PPB4_SPOS1|nr:hypothetical protein HMPREF1624_06786 [Sporothrix schenckii ATCC 58251]